MERSISCHYDLGPEDLASNPGFQVLLSEVQVSIRWEERFEHSSAALQTENVAQLALFF